MALPVSFYGETIADETLKKNGEPETGSWQVAITTITPANQAAMSTALGTLSGALNAIGIGNIVEKTITESRTHPNVGPATDPLAQRENKYLIRYHDATTNQKFRMSYPCADLTVKVANSEFIDLSAGVGAAVKTAFEAVVVSPDNSANAVVVDSIQFVGRNL